MTYFMLMSLNLVNDVDGIWHLSNFIAGDWEISLGRGLQRYADRARFGIVSEPFNSIITIFLVATANTVILRKFEFISPLNGFFTNMNYTCDISAEIICNKTQDS